MIKTVLTNVLDLDDGVSFHGKSQRKEIEIGKGYYACGVLCRAAAAALVQRPIKVGTDGDRFSHSSFSTFLFKFTHEQQRQP